MAFDDVYLVTSAIAPDGRWDGYVMYRIADVYRIESDGKYEHKIELLNKKFDDFDSRYEKTFDNSKPLLKQMLGIGAPYLVKVGLKACDELVNAEVAALDDTHVTLREVDEYGEEDGLLVLGLEDIDHAEIGSVDLRNIEYLRSQR